MWRPTAASHPFRTPTRVLTKHHLVYLYVRKEYDYDWVLTDVYTNHYQKYGVNQTFWLSGTSHETRHTDPETLLDPFRKRRPSSMVSRTSFLFSREDCGYRTETSYAVGNSYSGSTGDGWSSVMDSFDHSGPTMVLVAHQRVLL